MIFNPKTTTDLINAIVTANQTAGAHTIYLEKGKTYEITSAYSTPNGLPAIDNTITIIGNNATIARNSASLFRLFRVNAGKTLTLKGVTLRNGQVSAPFDGGAIENAGTLYLTQCKITQNVVQNTDDGGGIYVTPNAVAVITNCIISENSARDGGGIANIGGKVTLKNCQLLNNTASNNGGGLYSHTNTGSKIDVRNTLFSGNTALQGGGVAALGGTGTIWGCDLDKNKATNGLGGSLYKDGTVTLAINQSRLAKNADTSLYNHSGTRINAQYNWWGAANGPSGVGAGVGDSISSNADYVPWLTTEDCLHEALCECPINFAASDCYATSNPISLRLGEKRLEETDLTVHTAAELLSFMRSYRQDKLTDPAYQFMGLGWTHNHDIILTDPGSNNPITLLMPKGGKTQFTFKETRAGINYYQAAAGSISLIAVDPGSTNARYTLTAGDKSKWVFDSNKKLLSRTFPNNESWTYTHYIASDGADLDGKLKQISDGYGRSLQFTYLRDTNPAVYKRQKLWRVGDHTATGLDGATPAGRYIELDYMQEKLNGVPTSNNALLASVLDVRGKTWTYSYYGQLVGESATERLNWMTKRQSPSVDTTGDGVLDGAITLEELVYGSHTVELAVNGGMELDSDWTGVGAPPNNERVSAPTYPVDSGSYSRRVVANGIGQGIQGNIWHLVKGRKYTVTARVYIAPPAGGTSTVKMQVTGTTAFDRSTSVTGSWQTLQVLDYVPTVSDDVRLQFLATALGSIGLTEFYVDSVTIQETNLQITQKRGLQGAGTPALETVFKFAPGLDYTDEVVAGKTTKHLFDRGLFAGQQDAAGNSTAQKSGAQFRPEEQVDANGNPTWMNWSADGKALEQVVDALGQSTTFTYKTDDTLHESLDAEGRKTLYAYEDGVNPRQATLALVTNGNDLAVNGGMEVNSDWTGVNSPPTNQQTPAADSGQYARRVVAGATDVGIEGVAWDLEAGFTYTITARVYPVNGVVKMHVTSETAFDKTSLATGAWETLTAVYTPGTTVTGKKLQFLASGGAAEFYVDSVSISKAGTELAVNGGMEADSNWTGVLSPTTNERTVGADTGQYARRVIASAVGQGIQGNTWDLVANRTYVILARVYPVSGTVRMKVSGTTAFDKTTSGTGAWQTLRAVHKPSSGAVGVRLQFLADTSSAEFYVDTVHILDATMLLRWQEFTYDSKGRTVTEKTIDPADGITVQQQVTRAYYTSGNGNGLLQTVTQEDIGGANDVTTTYTYDAAGRVTKTQQSSNFGNCDISYTVYDTAGNVVASICNYDPGMSGDPTTAAEAVALYNASFPDKNRVTTHEYDTMGRRVKTTLNDGASFKQTTLTFYDALNRVARTISNYVNQSGGAAESPGLWVWSTANSRWEKSATDTTAISHGTDNNQNVIADIAYNARGMVRLQRDALGNVVLLGYDDAGRLVKTVQSASQPAYNNDYSGASPDPTLGSYSPSANVDKDIISSQTYDKAGNLVKSVDPLGAVTYTIVDALNRPVKVVRAAKDAATITLNPGDGGYNEANDPRSDNYAPEAMPDRDLIETSEYDALGRVVRTRRLLDNRPTVVWDTTLLGYDPLGRQVKVIRSASQSDYNIAGDPTLGSYSASTNPDQDIFTRTIYDAQGRVLETETLREDNSAVTKTRFVYDGLSRLVKTITNYVAQGASDPKDWVWDATDGRWEYPTNNPVNHGVGNDQNIIIETVYDSDGRVQSTRDVLGRVSRNVYDTVSWVTRTVANFVDQGEDPSLWVWDVADGRWEKSTGVAIAHGTDNDQNVIASTVYDAQGRVSKTIDHRNNETLYFYDVLGRRIKTVTNYLVQGASNPANWLWDATDSRWEDGSGNAIAFGTDKDQNRLSTTTYDLAGRVSRSRDAAGIETRFEYDALGRRTKTTANYVDGTYSASVPDEDLISTTAYNKGGQVTSATDARSTQTAFTYDKAGRRLTLTQAATSPLSSVSHTSYDKAGRVLREIRNYVPILDGLGQPISPDAKDGSGNWLFTPPHNGSYNDRNLITTLAYDLASRRSSVTNPAGNVSATAYFKDGQVKSLTDPESMVTQYRYDSLRRRTRIVQGFVDQGEDPALWVWDATDTRWEKSGGTAIAHGSNNDQNIIVLVVYDRAGRMVSLREPRGNLTTYAYDLLNRRKSLTNPISKTWVTAFPLLSTGGTRTTMTYPGVNGGSSYQVQRDFDRLGRLKTLQYLGETAPKPTPDVTFTYNNAGVRAKMSESNGSTIIRETDYTYDDVRRLTGVSFDINGDNSVIETVSYEYDAGGLRTKLTLPGSLNVVYTYDPRGQLVSLTDWDSQQTGFAYDLAGRLIAAERANGLRSRYQHDAAGRLRLLRHTKDSRSLAHFEYQVDKRGNRTQAFERLAHPTTTNDTTIPYNDKSLVLKGTWSEVGGFKESSDYWARLKLIFSGDAATLTMGTGPDHSIYDVYVDGSLWHSFDGYAASASQRDIVISLGIDSRKLYSEGPHLLEIRNRAEKAKLSSGHKVRFKQLVVADTTYDLHTIEYAYDNLSRLMEARYNPGTNLDAPDGDLLRRYLFTYDRSGNRLSESVAIAGGAPTVKNFTYNNANQMTSDGTNTFGYDNNGNLTTANGFTTTTWDRANRLLSATDGVNTAQYAYDGEGHRIKQTVGANITKYLLDLQPGLWVVLAETVGASTKRFVHGPMGIHAQEDASGIWTWAVQDALGNVRLEASNAVAVNGMRNFAPPGVVFGQQGSFGMPYGFTGEPMDSIGLDYLRARYYSPALGVFTALDPFEGVWQTPMSINGYSYVSGNPVNRTDPLGLFDWCTGVVQQNDRLWDIATEGTAEGGDILTTFNQLLAANPTITDPNNIHIGDVLTLPANTKAQGLMNTGSSCSISTPPDTPPIVPAPPPVAPPYMPPLPPQDCPTDIPPVGTGTLIGGYIEGVAGSFTAFGSVGTGVEVVYNFATFQRLGYSYTGSGLGSAFRAFAGQPYVGHVENFRSNESPDPNNFQTFNSQYGGWSDFVSGGGGPNIPFLAGATVGIIHFYTQGASPLGVYGNDIYLSVSVGNAIPLPGQIEGSIGSAYYTPRFSQAVSYIENCQVNIERLNTDIITGAGSPHFQGIFSAALPYRWFAVGSATIAALNYNANHQRCG